MITQAEVFDKAMQTALHIMATPHAAQVVTKLEMLCLDMYERGLKDGFNRAAEVIVKDTQRELV